MTDTNGAAFVIMLVVKVTAVLLLGCIIAMFARKADAAVRHAIWACTLAGALGLPLGMLATPAWPQRIAASSAIPNDLRGEVTTNTITPGSTSNSSGVSARVGAESRTPPTTES